MAVLLIKGRNLYRRVAGFGVRRQPWAEEAQRAACLAEKHVRGDAARAVRAKRKVRGDAARAFVGESQVARQRGEGSQGETQGEGLCHEGCQDKVQGEGRCRESSQGKRQGEGRCGKGSKGEAQGKGLCREGRQGETARRGARMWKREQVFACGVGGRRQPDKGCFPANSHVPIMSVFYLWNQQDGGAGNTSRV